MEKLNAIVEEGMAKLDGVLTDDQTAIVAKVIEAAAIRGMLEAQHHAVDACNECTDTGPGTARAIATAIRQKNDALIVNLSAMR